MITTHSIILYIVATIFGITGFVKLKLSLKNLAKMLPWTREFKPSTIRFLGFYELLGAILLAGPSIIKAAFYLTSYSAIGLSLVMILAGIYHSRKKQYSSLVINALLLVALLSIAFNFL